MTREEEQAARDAEEAKRAKEERRERERRDGRERERRRAEERARAERAPPKPKDWMRPLIRVRVIDKRLKAAPRRAAVPLRGARVRGAWGTGS
jgi:hypothetical protein